MAQISLLLDHAEGREGEEVADPYYGGHTGFEITWGDVSAGAKGLAKRLAETKDDENPSVMQGSGMSTL
jgi:low molecular weight protein-tyrosine phosphatase